MKTFAAAPSLYVLIQQIGTLGSAPREFTFPLGIAVAPDGRFVVADTESAWDPVLSNDRIQVFNADGTLAGVFGRTGSGDGQFIYPMGVAIDRSGRILVADSGNNRLQLFDRDFTHLKSFGSYGNFDVLDDANRDGSGNYIAAPSLDRFYFPTRVAMKPGTRLNDPTDTAGFVAVVDNGNHRVVVLDAMLNPRFAFGSFGTDGNALGNFEYPMSVGVDAERIYVTDPENHRIQMFDHRGRALASLGSAGASNTDGDLQDPYDAQPDGRGGLIVADSDRSRILVLRPDPATPRSPRCSELFASEQAGRCAALATDGTWYDARVFGRLGSGDAEFRFPAAVAMDASGRLAVVDTANHRIQLFAAANLRVATAAVNTAGPVNAGQTVGLDVTVVNEGAFDLTVSPEVTASLAGSLAAPPPAAIAAGGSAVFPFTFEIADIGTLTFAAAANGMQAGGGVLRASAVTTAPIEVAPAAGAKMLVDVTAQPALATPGTPLTIDVRVRNTGSVALSGVTAALDASPAGLVALPSAPAPLAAPLVPGATQTFTCRFVAAGAGQVTFRATVTAIAAATGNTVLTTASTAITIANDAQPPRTTVTVSQPVAASGWYQAPLTVTLKAVDDVAVAGVAYRVMGFHEQRGRVSGDTALVSIREEGGNELSYWAEDTSGLAELPHTVSFHIDATAPWITRGGVSPAPNSAGWVNRFPTVSFLAADYGSGIAFVTPSVTVATNGAGQVITGRAMDVAGNVAEIQNTVNVDTLAPSLQCTPDRQPNAGGWYSSNVTVTCAAADQPGLSGLAAVRAVCGAAPVTGASSASCQFTSDGVFTFVGEASDRAGNVSAQSIAIRIDRTPPVVTCGTARGGDLWPPNNKLVPWDTFVEVQDLLSGSANFTLVRALSSAWQNGTGDATLSGDVVDFVLGTPDTSGFVRSERAGAEDGRIYTLIYEGRDAAGNVSSCAVLTRNVPHDSRK